MKHTGLTPFCIYYAAGVLLVRPHEHLTTTWYLRCKEISASKLYDTSKSATFYPLFCLFLLFLKTWVVLRKKCCVCQNVSQEKKNQSLKHVSFQLVAGVADCSEKLPVQSPPGHCSQNEVYLIQPNMLFSAYNSQLNGLPVCSESVTLYSLSSKLKLVSIYEDQTGFQLPQYIQPGKICTKY